MSKQWGHGYWQGVEAARAENGSLVGLWFHSRHATGTIQWQGRVDRAGENGSHVVQLFEWVMGEPSVQKVVSFEQMSRWDFYPTAQDMRWAYHKENGGSADDWEHSERIVEMMNQTA